MFHEPQVLVHLSVEEKMLIIWKLKYPISETNKKIEHYSQGWLIDYRYKKSIQILKAHLKFQNPPENIHSDHSKNQASKSKLRVFPEVHALEQHHRHF